MRASFDSLSLGDLMPLLKPGRIGLRRGRMNAQPMSKMNPSPQRRD
jgi:hypothetical protein